MLNQMILDEEFEVGKVAVSILLAIPLTEALVTFILCI